MYYTTQPLIQGGSPIKSIVFPFIFALFLKYLAKFTCNFWKIFRIVLVTKIGGGGEGGIKNFGKLKNVGFGVC